MRCARGTWRRHRCQSRLFEIEVEVSCHVVSNHIGLPTLVVMKLIISLPVQHSEYLQNVGVALVSMKLVSRAIKTQDQLPVLGSSPWCCACVSLHRWCVGGIGCPAWLRSGKQAGCGGLICAMFKKLSGSLTATPGVGDVRNVGGVRMTIQSLLCCSHFRCMRWGCLRPTIKTTLLDSASCIYGLLSSAQPCQAKREHCMPTRRTSIYKYQHLLSLQITAPLV